MTFDEFKEVRKVLDPSVDNGLVPPSRVLNDGERKVTALVEAANLAVIQFVTEGIIPPEHQAHFMMHLQDYAARLYSGESVPMTMAEAVVDLATGKEPIGQTFSVDSRLGEVYHAAAEIALVEGRMEHKETAQQNRQQNGDQRGKYLN